MDFNFTTRYLFEILFFELKIPSKLEELEILFNS